MQPRICHLITTLYSRAGSTRRTLEIVRGLRGRGYRFDLLVGEDASDALIASVRQEGLRVERVPGLKKYVSPADDLRAFWALKKQFDRNRYDLVHTHLAKAGILGRLAARAAGVPLIVHTVHGPSFPASKHWIERGFYREIERFTAQSTHAIIHVGEELRAQYLQAGVGKPDKSHVIHTGRDFSAFIEASGRDTSARNDLRSSLGLGENDLVLGYVARIVPSKGHIVAIRAVGQLARKYPGLRLMFVGQANLPSEKHYRTYLEAEVEKTGLSDRVIFLDHQTDIERYYAMFDIFILPSMYEGLPNVVLEASIMGLPVVAFDCGGVREILGDRGEIVARGDLDGFRLALDETIANLRAGRLDENSANGAQKELVDRWGIESMLRKKDKLYRALLESNGSV